MDSHNEQHVRRRNRAYTTQTHVARDTCIKDPPASKSYSSRQTRTSAPSKHHQPANPSSVADSKALNNNNKGKSSTHATSGRSSQQGSRQRPLTSPPSPSLSTTTPFAHRRQISESPSLPESPALASPLPSPGYFTPLSPAADPRSPNSSTRRPPASHSSHGIETTRGPPIALITRGSYSADIARHIDGKKQKLADFGFAQQQLSQLGLISPGGTPGKKGHSRSGSTVEPPRPRSSRKNSVSSTRSREEAGKPGRMESDDALNSSLDESSGNDVSHQERERAMSNGKKRQSTATVKDGNQSQLSEDLFLNIAEDSPQQTEAKADSKKSRMSRANHRKSLPVNSFSSPRVQTDVQNGNPSYITKSVEPSSARAQTHQRRASGMPSPSLSQRLPQRQQSPVSGSSADQKSRYSSTGPGSSKDGPTDSSPSTQYQNRRRPSIGDNSGIPHRNGTYKRSNLHHTSAVKQDDDSFHIDTPQAEEPQTEYFANEEMDSLDSGPAPSTVWDELDDLKSRIRKLELTGKMPPTSAAAISNTSNDRPRTATTTVTTVSSSPKQHRKNSTPSEGAAMPALTASLHPMLHRALAKCKETLSPVIYRSLEASVNEALELCAMTGSHAPQGTTFTVASMVNGQPERQVRRKADNLCRSLTELCISLCDGKASPASPAFHHLGSESRRGSFHTHGSDNRAPSAFANNARDHVRSPSVELDGMGITRSPSRALSRIEARRTSIIHGDRMSRQGSEEPITPASARFARAGTSLLHSRHNLRDSSVDRYDDDDEEEHTLRAPSRAMTEFSHLRQQPSSSAPHHQRLSREYTSQEPLPQTSPLTHTSALRRPNNSDGTTPPFLRDRQPTITTRNYQELTQASRERTPLSATFDRNDLGSRSDRSSNGRSNHSVDLNRRQTVSQTNPNGARYELPHERGGTTSGGLARTGSLGSRRMMAAAVSQRERRFGSTTGRDGDKDGQ